MDEKAGTFLVTAADDAAVELADVADGQVVALSSNPGLSAGEVVEGTVAPDPPLGVSWSLVDVGSRYSVTVEAVDEPPSSAARALAEPLAPGELATEPADDGELHALRVPPGETAAAVEEVAGDEATTRRAARLGARRAEVRGADGVVAVRYRSAE
ncbi:MAG: DUF5812 family protein [Halobacteriales archaeon]|nr:DUF5812 family protein [Halobacteriales archaeon]